MQEIKCTACQEVSTAEQWNATTEKHFGCSSEYPITPIEEGLGSLNWQYTCPHCFAVISGRTLNNGVPRKRK